MKKRILTAALLIVGVGAVNAQLFVGGSLNLGYSGGDTNSKTNILGLTTESKVLKDANLNFGIAPRVGYFINDNVAVGLGLGYNLNMLKEYPTNVAGINSKDSVNTTLVHNFSVSPFVRYYFAKVKRFSFFGEATVFVGGGTSSYSEKPKPTTPVTTKTNVYNFNAGINITPYVSFNVNDHIDLELGLNALSLGYRFSGDVVKITDTTTGNSLVTKDNAHRFNCLFTTDNLLGTLGSLTIGMNYRF